MKQAIRSFPVPVSPVSNTVEFARATRRASSIASRIAGEDALRTSPSTSRVLVAFAATPSESARQEEDLRRLATADRNLFARNDVALAFLVEPIVLLELLDDASHRLARRADHVGNLLMRE